MADQEIHVTKKFGYVSVALDEDGTPLSHGERMVEVSPGMWKSPALIDVERFFEERIPLGGNEEQ